jgi:hypothetical protein
MGNYLPTDYQTSLLPHGMLVGLRIRNAVRTGARLSAVTLRM